MVRKETQRIEIYIGSQIEHASERAVLRELIYLLERDQQPAVILSNFSLGGRQIDFAVGLGNLDLVIEAKGYNRPVRGGPNGHWQVLLASGDWKDFRNPYVQTRDVALAVRDAMCSLAPANAAYSYPSSALVFEPNIPRGSDASGDFKVSVIGLNGLRTVLQKRKGGTFPLDLWRKFARNHHMTRVSTPEAACDAALADAEALIARYTTAFSQTYMAATPNIVPFTCHADGEAIPSKDIGRLVFDQNADVQLQGPSGCGKTLLATHAGLEFCRRDGLAIIITAKDYTDNIRAVLNREVGLLGAPSASTLLAAGRRLNRRILFILDGYNECVENERFRLTRGLAALARKYESNVLVTSQIPLERDDLLALRKIEITVPNNETKTAIALSVTGGNALSPETKHLLTAVASGLEARLVAEVGQELGTGCSRYALFDAYARKRLGTISSDGIRSLTQVAAYLSDRIAYSLSVRDLDRLADAGHVP